MLCGLAAGKRPVCIGCANDLPWIQPACARCGAALPATLPGNCCAVCVPKLPRGVRVISALAYAYPVEHLITAAKYRRRQDLADALGYLLADYLLSPDVAASLSVPNVLLPVPLHRWRFMMRGFNQADEVAQAVSRKLHIPLLPELARRIRSTQPQTRLSGRARLRNMRQAFAADDRVQGCSIAIIDDVFTTGATAIALANAVLAKGSANVQIWSVARTQAGALNV